MEESVDYGSDTSVPGDARTMSYTPMSEVHPPTRKRSAPCANGHDQKNQRDYVFTPPSVEKSLRQTTGQTFATWTIGPVAASLEEREISQALRKTKDEEDNKFIRWVPRTRRLSSKYALRDSVSVADVRLERQLRYDYAKLTARGQLLNRTLYALDTTVAASAGQTVTNNPPIDTTSGGNGLGESNTPMSSPNPGTHATSPNIGNGHDDDVVSGVSTHGTGGFLADRAASVEVGVPKEEHEKILLELNGLRGTLGKTQSALDAKQACVQALESGHTRIEAELDLLIRMQQPMARPTSAAQAPSSSRRTDPDTA
uniref:Uncharacterized protein n=1 Tax=Hyaloperonospora arabidopsidis (strain Emoy2) TaxID=559515 RepID=M4BEB3_HYAAE